MRALLFSVSVVVLAACDCGGRVMRQQGQLRADPASVDFGVAIPGQPIERQLTLENRGDAPVLISSIQLADSSSGFEVVTRVPRIEVGDSAQLTLRFSGRQVEGVSSTRLIIESDATNAPVLEVPLTARTMTSVVIDAGMDAGTLDAGIEVDAGMIDAGMIDAGMIDAGTDAGTIDAGIIDVDAGMPTDAGPAWLKIAAGYGHACGLRADGRTLCWGYNDEHQATADSGIDVVNATPIEVPINDVAELALGSDFSCARLASGSIRCWGGNASGQLGNGNTTPSAIPVNVLLINDAQSISAGWGFACAVRSDASVWCWGANASAQLGRGSTGAASSTPAQVTNLAASTHIAAGDAYACASTTTGGLTCWGSNLFYQTGQSTGNVRTTPTVVSGLTQVVDVTAGFNHTCVLKTDRTVWCFGALGNGRLGDGNTATFGQTVTPVQVSNLNDALEVRAGHEHTCARRMSGAVECWGNNNVGQLGTGDNVNGFVPRVALGITDATQLAIGSTGDFTCAVRGNGNAECWGFNWAGQLGGGILGRVAIPSVVPLPAAATYVTAGADSSCAVSNSEVWCWGDNSYGSLGDGTRVDRFSPVKVPGITTAVTAGVRETFGCALTSTGTVQCWGDNSSGQLGDGTQVPRTGSVTATVVGGTAVELAVGVNYACARLTTGSVRCWGGNNNGQLGDGSQMTRPLGVTIPGITDAVSIATGHSHTCVVRGTGAISCWGHDAEGQVGDSGTTPRLTPYVVTFVTDAVSVETGLHFTCVRTMSNAVRCWGDNGSGQLGDGTFTRRATAVSFGSLSDVDAMWAGGYHTCAKRVSGEVSCSGRNGDGDLGLGNFATPYVNVPTVTFAGATQISSGDTHVCALTAGVVRCSGRNRTGSVGDGNDSRIPARVLR